MIIDIIVLAAVAVVALFGGAMLADRGLIRRLGDAYDRIRNLDDALVQAKGDAKATLAAYQELQKEYDRLAVATDELRTAYIAVVDERDGLTEYLRVLDRRRVERRPAPAPSAVAEITADDPEPTGQLPAWREALAAIAADDDGVTTQRIPHPQSADRAASSFGAAA